MKGDLGKIVSVVGVINYKWNGYVVKTTKHKFEVLIDNDQRCCERWGLVSTEDNLLYFIGAELLEVKEVYEKDVVEQHRMNWEQDRRTMFVEFVTNFGPFQLVMYNDHNGYYSHEAKLIVDGEVLEMTRL